MTELTPAVVAVLAFCAIAGIAYVVGQTYLRTERLQRRLPALSGAGATNSTSSGVLAELVARHFDDKRFGFDDTLRSQLRLTLIRAGYFRRDAINFYVLWRLMIAALMPLVAYLAIVVAFPQLALLSRAIVILIFLGLGVIGPDAFVARRQRLLALEYRAIFPDFLDLLVVCVDAGLSLEAALDRVTEEMSRRNRAFGINLAVMIAEMRAGRSFTDALGTLADRLAIPEAQSLLAVLRQSSELGSDSAEALRVFGDELRDRRLLRAEEQASKLSVKMLIPLTLFIFPVVLMVVVLPLALKMVSVFLPAFK
jgi:tight adherence protein C